MQDQNLILVISVSLGLLLIVFTFATLLIVNHQKKLRQKQNELFKAVLEAEEREQTRLGQNLHDDMCPLLAIASTQLNFAATDTSTSPQLASNLLNIWNQLSEINNDLRKLSHELVAFDTKKNTLGQALESYALKHHHIFDHIHCTIAKQYNELSSTVASQLLRISKELMHNAVKHSGAKELWVELKTNSQFLILTVADNGGGFNTASEDGIGLQNIKHRAQTA